MLAILPHYVFADGDNQLVARSLPSKIIANTDGIIQVSAQTYGNTVDKVVAISSDPSIIQILAVENDPIHVAVDVKIRALNAGQTTIALAASGFSSLQLPVTVYPDSQGATNLLIKTTPNSFSTSGPTTGYVAVEATNADGIPTPVPADTQIKLSVSDSNIISLTDYQMIIKRGSYFTMEKFVTNKPGTAQITASSPSIQPISTTVTVNNIDTQYTLQAYAYPSVINSQKDAIGYVIVQLHDSAGNPVIAKNDIPVSVRIVNATTVPTSSNTSPQSPLVQVNDALIIKQGSYWGYVPVEFTSGVKGPLNVLISSKGYNVYLAGASSSSLISTSCTSSSTSTTSTSTTSSTSVAVPRFLAAPKNILLDDKSPMLYSLPILTTGNNELLGILSLVDSSGNPVLAKSDLSIRIDSTDASVVSIPGVPIGFGSQAAPIFGKVGNTVNPVTLSTVSDSPQCVKPTLLSPPKTTSGLVADPLITKVLPHAPFPLALYVTINGALDSFKNDFTALISPQESISPIQLHVPSGEPVFLTDETLLKEGQQNIAVTSPDYSSSFTVQGASPKPSSVLVDYPNQIFSNSKVLFSIDLLGGNQIPVAANHDMTIQLVSSNPSVLEVPDSVQIKKGSYYVTFDGKPKTSGAAQISILSDGIPLSTFNVPVTSLMPQVSIDSADHADNNYPVTATVTATYNQLPLAGMNVDWKITGASITNKDILTDKNGKATISMITNNPNSVSIEADVGGGPYQTSVVSKTVSINAPLASPSPAPAENTQASPQPSGFTVMGLNPLIFIIPGAGAAAFVVLKKKNMLEGITEKIGIGEKISGIKERMSELRQK